MERRRSTAIDILKFFAVLFITNSHFDDQYVYCKELATGGAIGDALFFFCSGYTLFLGRLGRFDAWYKRRLRRIIPSVLVFVFLFGFINPQLGLPDLLYYGANWFVPCILICYVPLYFVRKYAINNMNMVYLVTGFLIVSWYCLFFDPFHSWFITNCKYLDWMLFCTPMDKTWMYQWNYFKWLFFFLFMLFGAQMGYYSQQSSSSVSHGEKKKFLELIGKLIGCVIAFYTIPILIEKMPELRAFLIFSLLPLVGICYFFYNLSELEVMQKMYRNKYLGLTISMIGGLCLEIYLVQPVVRTTTLNHLFPLNILIIFVGIVIIAYLCRVLSRFFQEVLKEEDGINWKTIFNYI